MWLSWTAEGPGAGQEVERGTSGRAPEITSPGPEKSLIQVQSSPKSARPERSNLYNVPSGVMKPLVIRQSTTTVTSLVPAFEKVQKNMDKKMRNKSFNRERSDSFLYLQKPSYD